MKGKTYVFEPIRHAELDSVKDKVLVNLMLDKTMALEFIKEINPGKAYLTHISHLLGFHDEVEAILPENVHLAYDNLQITI